MSKWQILDYGFPLRSGSINKKLLKNMFVWATTHKYFLHWILDTEKISMISSWRMIINLLLYNCKKKKKVALCCWHIENSNFKTFSADWSEYDQTNQHPLWKKRRELWSLPFPNDSMSSVPGGRVKYIFWFCATFFQARRVNFHIFTSQANHFLLHTCQWCSRDFFFFKVPEGRCF